MRSEEIEREETEENDSMGTNEDGIRTIDLLQRLQRIMISNDTVIQRDELSTHY